MGCFVQALGDSWMDCYHVSGDLADLRQSRDLYAEAFEAAQDDNYTGINAAAKSVLLGSPEELDKGAAYARRVQEIVGTGKHPNDYWKTATVVEAFLIQQRFREGGRALRRGRGDGPEGGRLAPDHLDPSFASAGKLAPSAEERTLVQKPFEHVNR
jgi:hypothetical protein